MKAKKVCLLLVIIMLLIPMTAFASDMDIVELSTKERFDSQEWMFDAELFSNIMFYPEEYGIEQGGKLYSVADVIAESKVTEGAIDVVVKKLCSIEELKEVNELEGTAVNIPKKIEDMTDQDWDKLRQIKAIFDEMTDNQKAKLDIAQLSWRIPTKSSCFEFEADTGEIIGYGSCLPANVVIPDTIDGVAVVGFGKDVFNSCEVLESMDLNSGLKSIGDKALTNTKIVSMVIPDSVETIGSSVFYNCTKLSSLTLPKGLKEIGSSLCENCVLTEINIPVTVTSISEKAFLNNKLTEVYIPDGVTSIGSQAFANNGLKKVSLPKGCDYAADAFIGNPELAIEIRGVGVVTDAKYFVFDSAANIIKGYSAAGPKDVIIPKAIDGVPVLHIGGVVSEEDRSFMDMELTSVVLPEGLRSIGSQAFRGNSLKSMVIPNTVGRIGMGAFAFNRTLTSIKLPDELLIIPEFIFEECRLTEITIPETVISIGERAFQLNRLAEVYIPDSVETIGAAAFDVNDMKKASLPKGCVYESDAFADNPDIEIEIRGVGKLTPEKYFEFDIVSKTITGYSEDGPKDIMIPSKIQGYEVLHIANGSNPQFGGAGSYRSFYGLGLTSVVFPEGLQTIGEQSFRGNSIKSLVIPNSVNRIGMGAFAFNKTLTSVKLPDALERIEYFVFEECRIEKLTIPETVEVIGDRAFQFNAINEIYIPDGVLRIEDEAFGHNKLGAISIPSTCSYYGTGYNAFAGNPNPEIVIRKNEKPTAAKFFDFEPETNTIKGYSSFGPTQIIIPDSIDGVPVYHIAAAVEEVNLSFQNMSLASVVLPEGLKTIGEAAFELNGLTEIRIPDSVTKIDKRAFSQNNLGAISIPSTCEYYTDGLGMCGEGAFCKNPNPEITVR